MACYFLNPYIYIYLSLTQVNLLKDAWLLPVHGHGTFANPFEVDISLLDDIGSWFSGQQKTRPKTRVQVEMNQDWVESWG